MLEIKGRLDRRVRERFFDLFMWLDRYPATVGIPIRKSVKNSNKKKQQKSESDHRYENEISDVALLDFHQ